MARIAGVNLPVNKRALVSLTYIHGIGPKFALDILKANDLDHTKRIKDFTEDEIVYQGFNLDTSTFSGTVLSWNSITNKLLLINTKGIPVGSRLLHGTESLTFRTVTSYTPGTLNKWSGRLLYVDNIQPIIRSSDQTETFKIVVKF